MLVTWAAPCWLQGEDGAWLGAGTAPKAVGETPAHVPQGARGTSETGSCISTDQRDDGEDHCSGGRTGEYSSFGDSKGVGVPSHPFTCWFNPKPCTGATSCLNWKIVISRVLKKALQQVSREKPFPPLTWECSFLGGFK